MISFFWYTNVTNKIFKIYMLNKNFGYFFDLLSNGLYLYRVSNRIYLLLNIIVMFKYGDLSLASSLTTLISSISDVEFNELQISNEQLKKELLDLKDENSKLKTEIANLNEFNDFLEKSLLEVCGVTFSVCICMFICMYYF